MRAKLANLCIFLGLALVISALALFFYNQQQALHAQNVSRENLKQLLERIEERETEEAVPIQPITPVELLKPEDLVMTEEIINGHAYIGYLTIPKLELELPVMSGWDYDKLQIAPCRFTGTLRGEDLVIMAHNYPKHFGRLTDLREGDTVIFTDMDGMMTTYEIVARDVLNPNAVEDMTTGNFDLTLFTCTYGGENRVTVFCDKI